MRTTFLTVATVGLVLAMAGRAAAVNIVLNPGFESGDLTSWTQSGNTGFTGVIAAVEYIHSGTFGLFAGPQDSEGFIEQELPTVVGEQYTLSYWLNNQGFPTNLFQVFIEGAPLGSQTLTDVGPFGYALFVTTFTAVDPSTTLRFGFRHDPSFWGLDDISVEASDTPVPEPASVWLLGTGLALAARKLRRREMPVHRLMHCELTRSRTRVTVLAFVALAYFTAIVTLLIFPVNALSSLA